MFPVWTRVKCSPPLPSTPKLAVRVLDGGNGNYPASTCIEDPTQTTLNGAVIAAQCCDKGSGECRRYIGSNDNAGCVAGRPPRPYHYSEVEALCAERGLGLCKSSCKNAGCWYDANPVWTDAPC